MIIVSITGPDTREALAQVRRSSALADAFEFRLDLISRPDIPRLLTSSGKPTIVTCRPVWEGGAFKGSERARIAILNHACTFNPAYVDIEWAGHAHIMRELMLRRQHTRVIVSRHLFDRKTPDVKRTYSALHRTGADVIKFAFPAFDVSDAHHAFDFLALARRDRRKAIAVAMGECGEISRILYRKFGGWATYAGTEDGKSAAPGQLPASRLKRLYSADKLSARSRVYGVVGYPLEQSKGIYLHNPLFHAVRADAVYCRFPVTDLSSFMGMIAPHLSGFSVTIPHKETIMRFLDRVDPTALRIGAVNTVLCRKGKFFGLNTDAAGALDAVEKVQPVAGKRILIVGAGGAARAIAYEADRRGAVVLIANRAKKKAENLAREFGLRAVPMSGLRSCDFDILMNATSVGMVPKVNASPVPAAILHGKIVFDAVYNPPVTKLLRDASRQGAKVIRGTEMYLNQAAKQFSFYTGKKLDPHLMRKIFSRIG